MKRIILVLMVFGILSCTSNNGDEVTGGGTGGNVTSNDVPEITELVDELTIIDGVISQPFAVSKFSDLTAGVESTKTITIKNTTTEEMPINYTWPTKFNIKNTTCKFSLPAGESCDFIIGGTIPSVRNLSQVKTGPYLYEQFRITLNNDEKLSTVIDLVATLSGGAPIIHLSKTFEDLTATAFGERTDERGIRITNIGTSTMSLEIPTAKMFDRSEKTTCGTSLEPGKSCELYYSFLFNEDKKKYQDFSQFCEFESPESNENIDYYKGEEIIFIGTNAVNVMDYSYECFDENEPTYTCTEKENASAFLRLEAITGGKKVFEYTGSGFTHRPNGAFESRLINYDWAKMDMTMFYVRVKNISGNDIDMNNLNDVISPLTPKWKYTSASTCRNGTTLKNGESCTVVVSYDPKEVASFNGYPQVILIKGECLNGNQLDPKLCYEWDDNTHYIEFFAN